MHRKIPLPRGWSRRLQARPFTEPSNNRDKETEQRALSHVLRRAWWRTNAGREFKLRSSQIALLERSLNLLSAMTMGSPDCSMPCPSGDCQWRHRSHFLQLPSPIFSLPFCFFVNRFLIQATEELNHTKKTIEEPRGITWVPPSSRRANTMLKKLKSRTSLGAVVIGAVVLAGVGLASGLPAAGTGGNSSNAGGSPPGGGAHPELRAAHAPDRLLVKFRQGTSSAAMEHVHGLMGAAHERSFRGDSGLRLIRVPRGRDLAAVMADYRRRSEVLYIEPDYIMRAFVQPNDPRFGDQWGLENVGQFGEAKVCLGGGNSGLSCTTDAECSGSCSLVGGPCFYDWECQDVCSQNFAPCNFNSDCECDTYCAGGVDHGDSCIFDSECDGACQGGLQHGQRCNYDFECGTGLCQGGGNPGASCTSDFQCSSICQGGGNPGASCTNDFQCTSICQGGGNPGASCTNDFQCTSICQGGGNPGASCTNDFQCTSICAGGADAGDSCTADYQCGGACQGGTNPGASCSQNYQCFGGGTCITGTCSSGACSSGSCSQGSCSGGFCNEPSCAPGLCLPSDPGCVPGGACVTNLCIDASCGSLSGLNDFDIDAAAAWNIQRESPGVIIAVLDTGVDFSHEDIGPSWVNPGEIAGNGLDDDGNGFVDDVNGWDFVNNDNDPFDDVWHGTFTTGVAAATGDNGLGISGVTWSAQIMALKILNEFSAAPTSDIISAIDYATDMGAHVTNNSWGGGAFSQSLKDAISRADQAGILFVAAAGNYTADNDLPDPPPAYPASYDNANIISVAAMDRHGILSDFSNWGLISVDLGAPGSEILSTTPYAHKYGYEDGTSFAAPYVSGAIALMYAINPKLDHLTAKQIILSTVVPDDDLDDRSVSGGMLNLAAALSQTPSCPPTTCAEVGANCGTIDDGCGAQASCGACGGNDVCQDNVCVCQPTTCAAEGAECGVIDDGCGVSLDCGGCSGMDECQANVCVCVPRDCTDACGIIDDGCGGEINCGSCGGGGGRCDADIFAVNPPSITVGGSGGPVDININVCNGFSGSGSYTVQVNYDLTRGFISVPRKGTILGSTEQALSVTLNPGRLPPGRYTASLEIRLNGDAGETVVSVPVIYDIQP